MDTNEDLKLPTVDNSPLVASNQNNPTYVLKIDKNAPTKQAESNPSENQENESEDNASLRENESNASAKQNDETTSNTKTENDFQNDDNVSHSNEHTHENTEKAAHRVTFKFTISVAYADGDNEPDDRADSGYPKPVAAKQQKKKKRVLEAPKAQNYFHFEYLLVPEGEDRVR